MHRVVDGVGSFRLRTLTEDRAQSYGRSVKPETALGRLIKAYGIRRALTLMGAASVVAIRGWDVLTGDEAYSRQGVWTWKRDLEAAGVDPSEVEWEKVDRKIGEKAGALVEAGTAARRRQTARAARGTSPA